VGVCLERTPAMMVALLAVLKTGAAYVPMDPDFPEGRLAFMLSDATVALVIAERSTAARLPQGTARVLRVDEPGTAPPRSAARAVHPDSRAYVIYTSGSTGKPKGVELRHRNVVNFLTAMRARPGLAADDVLIAVTTLSFDIAA